MLSTFVQRHRRSLPGLLLALGLSTGVVAGSMHNHAVDDASALGSDVCVLAAGSAVGTLHGVVRAAPAPPPVEIVRTSTAPLGAPRPVVRTALARGPPSVVTHHA